MTATPTSAPAPAPAPATAALPSPPETPPSCSPSSPNSDGKARAALLGAVPPKPPGGEGLKGSCPSSASAAPQASTLTLTPAPSPASTPDQTPTLSNPDADTDSPTQQHKAGPSSPPSAAGRQKHRSTALFHALTNTSSPSSSLPLLLLPALAAVFLLRHTYLSAREETPPSAATSPDTRMAVYAALTAAWHASAATPAGIMSALLLAALAYLALSAVYNIYFHPLAHHPGPLLARASVGWQIFYAYQKNLHLVFRHLHSQYGPVVRIAPNRLIFESPKAYSDIYRSGASIQKSSGYAPHPYYPGRQNLNNIINLDTFRARKGIVSQAFLEPALRRLDPLLIDLTERYCNYFDGKTVNMGTMTFCFGLDAASTGVLGSSFGLLENPAYRWLLSALLEGNQYMYLRLAWPSFFNSRFAGWLGLPSILYPDMTSQADQFEALCAETMERSRAEGIEPVLKQVIESVADPKTGARLDAQEVWDELLLIIRAAGDTTSAALASFFFYISRNARAREMIFTELQHLFYAYDDIVPGPRLNRARFLRASIDEAMRLTPPAPAVFWRETTNAMTIDGTPVPLGTDVGVSVYGLQRNADYLRLSDQFWPDRFLSEADEEAAKKAGAGGGCPYSTGKMAKPVSRTFSPFQTGPRACPGRPLAYREMMLLTARVLYRYVPEPVTGIGGGQVIGGHGGHGRDGQFGRGNPAEFQILDTFSTDKLGPYVKFVRRTR